MTTFSVLILNYQSTDYVVDCLESVSRQIMDKADHLEIILADNGSDEVGLRAIAARFGAIFVQNGHNFGYAGGNNRAAAAATGEWLLILNPDVRLRPDFISQMKRAMTVFSDDTIFGSVGLMADQPHVFDSTGDGLTAFGMPWRMDYGRPVKALSDYADIFSASGSALMIKRSLFEQLGGFDERFFCYCEDVDLGLRARLLGHRAILVGRAQYVHLGSKSTGVRSDFALFYGIRNRIWLYIGRFPLALLIFTLPIHLIVSLGLYLKDILAGRGRIVASALKAAISGLPEIWAQRSRLFFAQSHIVNLTRALTWNVFALFARSHIHRQVEPPQRTDLPPINQAPSRKD